MGRSIAVKLAQEGALLAICDVDESGMEESAALARKANPKVTLKTYVVDVCDQEGVKAFAIQVSKDFDNKVHGLFANAGISGAGELIHLDKSLDEVQQMEDSWDRCFNVDFFGVLYSLRAFVPLIVKQDEGHIIVTSSVNGFWSWPNHGSYTAAKFGVRGLAESLLMETYVKAPHVHVTCVHPGGIQTSIAKNSLEKGYAHQTSPEISSKVASTFLEGADLSSDEAADWILNGVRRNDTRILVGYDAMCLDAMSRMDPHKSYDLWKALGKEGVVSLNPTQATQAIQQIKNISILGWLRIAFGGGLRFAVYLMPFVMMKLRRYPIALAAIASAFGYKLLKSKI